MPVSVIRVLLTLSVSAFLWGCSSLTGSSRDAIAPFVELSKPQTVDNVIVGGTNPYATSVPNVFGGSGNAGGAAPSGVQTIAVVAPSQAQALPLLHQAMAARCGGAAGVMGPAAFIQGQWMAQIQCGGT